MKDAMYSKLIYKIQSKIANVITKHILAIFSKNSTLKYYFDLHNICCSIEIKKCSFYIII